MRTADVRPGLATLLLLGGSALAIALAPFVMPDDYDWVRHGISESAAQGVDGAWVARTGFLLFGGAVTWLSVLLAASWQPAGRWLHRVFGLSMFAVAAFSTRPWAAGAPYVSGEDLLHSVFATAMGFAFILGAISIWVVRRQSGGPVLTPDIVVAIAATALSTGMATFPDISGLLQRVMFAVAYAWYAREALDAGCARPPATEKPPAVTPGAG